jgi:hypothetical protein
LLLITALTAIFTPVMVDIWPEPKINIGIKIFLIASYAILATSTALTEMARQRTEARLRAQRADIERQLKEQLHGLLVRGGLLHGVSHEISEVLSEVRREVVQAIADGTPGRFLIARERTIKAALRSLCEVLRSDRSRTRDERLAATYFKATLFELDISSGRAGVLRRAYWHYPITKQPQTHQFDVYHDPNAGAVQCYVNGTMIVMQRVTDAAAAGRVWKDMRDGQRQEYANSSMVCVPVWADRDNDQNVRGVVTVDTNITDYFQSSEEEIGFMNELFAPFLEAIRLVYVVTEAGALGACTSTIIDTDSDASVDSVRDL